MSKETLEDLNTRTLIGMTDQRGNAWHWRASLQGEKSNHYPGAIPIEDVRERLIPWYQVPRKVAVEKPATLEDMTHIGDDGQPMKWVVQPDRQAIDTSDTNETLGLFKSGYKIHQFEQWLLDRVEGLLGEELVISSAGLLRKRAVMWTEISVPETKNVCGVYYRPNLLSASSFDGTLSSTFKRTIGATVCDNTLSAALSEGGTTLKFKHTKNNGFEVAKAREGLAILDKTAENFEAAVKTLTSAKISHLEFKQVLNVLVPVSEDDSPTKQTATRNKQNALTAMLVTDPRVEPWADNAFGVLQLFNTWNQHERDVRGNTQRAERNMWDSLSGKVEQTDAEVLEALHGLQLV
jgi:phage/plasmid-like protein (TIGR03299 family)